MGKALNRGKVVGPVPWPLWPYVRGTGRAGMGHTPPLNLGVVGESMWSPAAIAGHPVSKPHKVGARWPPRATWTPGPTDAGETGGGETGPARRADRARQSAEQSKTARFFQNVFCRRRRGRHPA